MSAAAADKAGAYELAPIIKVKARYIEEHRDEVIPDYERNLERVQRGNPPQLQARFEAMHGTARAKFEELRRSKTPDATDALITANRNDDGADSLEAVRQSSTTT